MKNPSAFKCRNKLVNNCPESSRIGIVLNFNNLREYPIVDIYIYIIFPIYIYTHLYIKLYHMLFIYHIYIKKANSQFDLNVYIKSKNTYFKEYKYFSSLQMLSLYKLLLESI